MAGVGLTAAVTAILSYKARVAAITYTLNIYLSKEINRKREGRR